MDELTKSEIPSVDEAKDMLKDRKKMSEIVAKIKQDRTIIPNTMKLLKQNPEIERNARDMAQEMDMQGSVDRMPLQRRKKLAQQQEAMHAMMRNAKNKKNEEHYCVIMAPGGGISSSTINVAVLETDEWCSHPAANITNAIIIASCKAGVMNQRNRNAAKIMGKPVNGHVYFILLDEELQVTDLKTETFKELIKPILGPQKAN